MHNDVLRICIDSINTKQDNFAWVNKRERKLQFASFPRSDLENGCGSKADLNLKTMYCAFEALILGLQVIQDLYSKKTPEFTAY